MTYAKETDHFLSSFAIVGPRTLRYGDDYDVIVYKTDSKVGVINLKLSFYGNIDGEAFDDLIKIGDGPKKVKIDVS